MPENSLPDNDSCGISGMTLERVTMTELAEELSRSGSMIDRKVVDRTGLSGAFDASLGLGFLPASIVLTRYPVAGALLEPLGVRSIFNALPEQLGLKLTDATVPGDVLVIDRADRPAVQGSAVGDGKYPWEDSRPLQSLRPNPYSLRYTETKNALEITYVGSGSSRTVED